MATIERWTYQREDTNVRGEHVEPLWLVMEGDQLVAEVYSEEAARLIVDAVNARLGSPEPSASHRRRSLRELDGLGAELWRSSDSTAYLNEERKAWDG